jgi:hypothetical protein
MKPLRNLLLILTPWLLLSCAATNKQYDPSKKYDRKSLQEDYVLLRNILETKHPSLYWYTPKDSMDLYFNRYSRLVEDSMTEQQFGWKIIAPLIDKIHCGHTSFGMSKEYGRWVRNKRFASFPLSMKVWNDTMAVTTNLNRKDPLIKKGTLIKSINGLDTKTLVNRMFDYMPEDGHANNVNYIRLSSNFPYYHRNIFGLSKQYNVVYIDSNGNDQLTKLPLFEVKRDSSKKQPSRDTATVKMPKASREERLKNIRSLSIDTANNSAVMVLNTFSANGLRVFYRRSFRNLKKMGINSLVIDLRSNGGGRINLSTLLTRYVTRQSFRVADTAFSVAKTLKPYTRYIKGKWLNNVGLFFTTTRKTNGQYHFRHWERKMNRPKKMNHYNGNVYVLINGPTFSASTLFCNAVKGQVGITLVGEEAGGGWHGNNGIMIPDITLPNTHLRVRLPLFRLVQYNHVPKNGLGVMPDVYVGTSYDALLKGYDKKMQVVMEMIKANNAAARP